MSSIKTAEIEQIRKLRSALRRLEREITSRLKKETGCCGVTTAQCHILLELDELGESNISELSERFGLDKSTLSRSVESLVNGRLVRRTAELKDRRYSKLELTPQGENAVARINCLCDTGYSDLFSHIPAEEHERILHTIETLAQGMAEARMHPSSKEVNERTCETIIIEEIEKGRKHQ